MTSTSPGHKRVVRLTGEEFRALLPDALAIYVAAMNYPPGTAQRAPMWLTHILRAGWRSVAAFDSDDTLVGLAYGYRGSPGQWWYEQVRRGVLHHKDEATADAWLSDDSELTEIHVRPDHHGRGLGRPCCARCWTVWSNGTCCFPPRKDPPGPCACTAGWASSTCSATTTSRVIRGLSPCWAARCRCRDPLGRPSAYRSWSPTSDNRAAWATNTVRFNHAYRRSPVLSRDSGTPTAPHRFTSVPWSVTNAMPEARIVIRSAARSSTGPTRFGRQRSGRR